MKISFVLRIGEQTEEKSCEIGDLLLRFSLFDLDFFVEKTGEADEYEISFVPNKSICPDEFFVLFSLDENEFEPKETYYYQSGISTNSFARIVRADNTEPGLGSGRDIFMLQSGDRTYNAAFTTFERFYTYFMFENGASRAVWSLEGKEVEAGQKYTLERILINEGKKALPFFEDYTSLLQKRLCLANDKPIPCGWSSWSCYAGGINRDKIYDNAKIIADEFKKQGASLIQLDDGWQSYSSFNLDWETCRETFPDGLRALCEDLKKLGLSMGLWMSAGLLSAGCPDYKIYSELINRFGGEPKTSFGDVYPLDLGNETVLEKTRKSFEKSKNERGAAYFKVDFLMNTLCRMGAGETLVFYEKDYSVALYKKFIGQIRRAVGNDVFLLACGSPIGESAGVFDAIRVSPDIVWGGAGSPAHPGGWKIMTLDAQNAVLRSPYHRKVFINDPDALLTREYGWGDDGLHLTESEALTWATAVAFSGGHILINDIMMKLPAERKKIFASIIPPYGKAARPFDFFEYPMSSHSFITIDEKSVKTELHALYNWEGEKPVDKTVFCDKQSLIIDCHTSNVLGMAKGEFTLKSIEPHACRAVCIKEIEDHPFFAFCDENIYLGAGTVADSFENGVLKISSTAQPNSNFYIFAPEGDTVKIELNGKPVETEPTNILIDGGIILKIIK